MFLCQALMHKQGKMSMKNKIKFKKILEKNSTKSAVRNPNNQYLLQRKSSKSTTFFKVCMFLWQQRIFIIIHFNGLIDQL